MAKAATQQQAVPGAEFRGPGVGIAPRIVQEVGPFAIGTVQALNLGTNTNVNAQKLQTLDVVRGYILELDFAINYEKDAGGDAINVSTFQPFNLINNISVQFESAYQTYHATGIIAFIHQLYRPMFGPKNIPGAGIFQGSAGSTPANALGSTMYSGTAPLSTPNLALVAQTNASGTTQSFKLFLEIPVSMYFDLYWDLAPTGQPTALPVHRAIVSPQFMAATTRNVTPSISFNALQTVNDTYDSPFAPTASGKVGVIGANGAKTTMSFYRDAWIPGTNPVTAPPVYGWQASLDYIAIQPNQANPVPVTLDNSVVGQGQILSLFFFIWDPGANSGVGAIVPIASYALVELLYGSQVQLRQQTPQQNMYEWASLHTTVLPSGVFGWDLAVTREGLITNEAALNSLVMAGTQIRVTFVTGSVPGSSATLYCALETLKKVGS